MSKVDTVLLGNGKNAVLVNKDDYDNNFPLNEKLRDIKAGIEEKALVEKAAKEKKAAETK